MRGWPLDCEVVGQMPPRASGAQHVEDRVNVLAQPVVVDALARLRRVQGEQRFQRFPCVVSGVAGAWLPVLVRHTTFRFCPDPTVEQSVALTGTAGAVESFRRRNKHPKGGKPPIRVGDSRPRSVKNHRPARSISDAAWTELAGLIHYRMDWRGGEIVAVDRWFPSSKTCSDCAAVDQDLTLAQRTYNLSTGFKPAADRPARFPATAQTSASTERVRVVTP
jgi:hypothetical protein